MIIVMKNDFYTGNYRSNNNCRSNRVQRIAVLIIITNTYFYRLYITRRRLSVIVQQPRVSKEYVRALKQYYFSSSWQRVRVGCATLKYYVIIRKDAARTLITRYHSFIRSYTGDNPIFRVMACAIATGSPLHSLDFPTGLAQVKTSPTFTSSDLFTPFSTPRATLPSIG